MRRVIKEVQPVQMFLSPRAHFGLPRRALLLLPVLLAATPARAASAGSVMDDAQAVAVDTGAAIGAFAQRILAGDMAAVQAAAFGFSALIAFLGLWLLFLRGPRDETVIALPDEAADAPFVSTRKRTFAQPAPIAAPGASAPVSAGPAPSADRPARLLDAVAAAKAQFEIGVAERRAGR